MNVCQECDEYEATDTFIMVWFVPFFFSLLRKHMNQIDASSLILKS